MNQATQSTQSTLLDVSILSGQPTESISSTQSSECPKRIDPPPETLEVWASLESHGYPNYEVSTFGRVRNAIRKNFITGWKNRDGYIWVGITHLTGKQRLKSIHFFVAIAFIPNPENKPSVDHIDRIRDNNYVGNLRWATPEEQMTNRREFKNKGQSIYQYALDGTLIRCWEKISDAAATLNIGRTSISSVCNRKRPTAGGYIWRYCDVVDVLEGEEWRNIPFPEYPNVQASSCGRIKLASGHITTGSESGSYNTVQLVNTTNREWFAVHQLVAAAFHGRNDDPKLIVNHKDGNKKNNRADNLEYCTKKENTQHAKRIGLIPEKNLYKRKVIQFDLDETEMAEYESAVDAAKDFGVAPATIRKACWGMNHTAVGFKWRYADQ
jgi:hypothetical protein